MKGSVYIIKSKQTNKVYVGSTVETLNRRFGKHKSDKTCTSVEILKYNDAEIELIECYECEDEEQLRRREGEYQREYDCVNKRIEGRTPKERGKEYYEKNKQAIAEKKNEKFTCPCGGKYTHSNKSLHFKTKKHLNYHGKLDRTHI